MGETVDGQIKNNDQHSFNVQKAFTISDERYNALVSDVKSDASNPPEYTLKGYNCTDWVISEAAVAGVDLPSHDVNTPADLGQDLIQIGSVGVTAFSGPEQGSSDHEDPQKKNDLSSLFKLNTKEQK